MSWRIEHHRFRTGPRAGLLAAVLMVAAAPTAMYAQPAPLNAKLALRPVTRGDIAAYKLASTTQTSAGFTTVGLGQPAYAEVWINSAIPEKDIAGVVWQITYKPKTSSATLEESPLTKDVPPFEPSDRSIARVAGRTMLRPDVPGMYVISGTVTAGASGTATVLQTIIGGTYVGKASCLYCHSGGLAEVKGPDWAKTRHSFILREGVEGMNSDHYGANCIACHSVGYDANAKAVNGGFDDVAKKLGWSLTHAEKGVYDAMPAELKNLGDIQCENCHGPGSQHVKSGGNTVEISVSKNSNTCAICHDAPANHIKQGEWVNSRHAVVVRSASGEGREGCVKCHTGTGFIDSVNKVEKPNVAYSPVSCDSCHEPHGQVQGAKSAHLVRTVTEVKLLDGTVVKEGGLGLLCMNCHQARQNGPVYAATAAASSRFGPHHGPQADMLAGANAYTYGQKIPSGSHGTLVEDSCAGCHMQAITRDNKAYTHIGGHTFSMAWTAEDKTVYENTAACEKCHGEKGKSLNFATIDYDGDGKYEGVQTEVQGLLDQLSTLLPPDNAKKDALTITSTWTRAQLQAAYNWQFVKEDKSLGIHNTAYAVGILKASIADLTKK